MEYVQSIGEGADIANSAMTMMEERGIPPHPNNFTVWYNYFSGAFPDLKRALDILLDSDAAFSADRCAAVYQKFCAGPYDAVPMHMIAERMEAELSAVLATVERAGRDVADYGKTLETASDQLAQNQPSEGLSLIIGRVLEQTRIVARQSRDVEKQLAQSWSEVNMLNEELEGARKEAMTDALTGIPNRKMFDFSLKQAAMEAMETREPLSLLFIDVDHFKNFNDTHGHHVGDQVLKLLASILKDSVKGQDTAARFGGEEFAVILPSTELENGAKLADKIRLRVAGKSMVNRKTGAHLGRCTISVGVASFAFGEPLRQFIERADRALYAAKNGGRNRVVSQDEIR